MNTGLTEAQIHDFITVLDAKVAQQEADGAAKVLGKVLNNRTH